MSWGRAARRLVLHRPGDPVAFWRARAAEPGRLSVMWRNPAYNEAAHADQWAAIRRHLPGRREAVLDLGCGTGRLSAALAGLFARYVGVDLDTMVEEARRRNPGLDAEFVAATAQDYDFPQEAFDLVLSMACLASACRAEEMPEMARRIVGTTRAGGRVVLIDPFHAWPALARTCRMSPRAVVSLFTGLGLHLAEWSSLHFVPFRLLLAGPGLASWPRLTAWGYHAGEALRAADPKRLGDYSVMAFSKPAVPERS